MHKSNNKKLFDQPRKQIKVIKSELDAFPHRSTNREKLHFVPSDKNGIQEMATRAVKKELLNDDIKVKVNELCKLEILLKSIFGLEIRACDFFSLLILASELIADLLLMH